MKILLYSKKKILLDLKNRLYRIINHNGLKFCTKGCIGFFSIFVFAGPIFFHNVKAEVAEKVIAIVNNDAILKSDLEVLKKKAQEGRYIDDLLLEDSTLDDLIRSDKIKLNYLISEKIIELEIKKLNLSVTMERVEQEIRQVATKNNMTYEDMIASFKKQNQSFAEYQKFMKSRIEKQSLIEMEVSSRIRVSDEAILAKYQQKNPNSKTASFEYTISHIFFNPKKGGEASVKERAKAVLNKLSQGAPFDTVAEQYSEDPKFSSGGLLGMFKAGEFSQEFEHAVSAIQVGEVTPIVKSKSGFHILKLLGKKIIADPKYEKEKENLRIQIFEEAFVKHFRVWLKQKRDNSFVRINVQFNN